MSTINTNTMLEAALSYAERGWPVLPLAKGSKAPAIKGGAGVRDATTDLNTVEAWWSAYPERNIGLATGHAFDVLDIDSNSVSWELKYGGQSFPLNFKPHQIVKTKKGYHIYVNPTGYGNRVRFVEDMDFRGKGGYVVAPPSIVTHPLLGDSHLYEALETPICPEPAPEIVLTKLKLPELPDSSSEPSADIADSVQFLSWCIERMLEAKKGKRNHTLNQLSFWLYRYHSILGANNITSIMTRAAEKVGLESYEIQRTLRSASEAASYE